MEKCTVCLNESRVHPMDDRIALFHCDACGHTFTVKARSDHEVYEERYYTEKHPNWFANPNLGLFDKIERVIRRYARIPGKKLLDVGCGNGDFLKYYARQKYPYELYGIDFLKLEYPGVNFRRGDFYVDEYDKTFDILVNLMVIEHVPDPQRFVKRMKEHTAPGGLLVISTNNNGGLLYSIARWMKRSGSRLVFDRVYSDHHLQHFTNRSLKQILEMNGFEILRGWNHNYPMRSVDTPPASPVVKKVYLAVVFVVFTLSGLLGNGFLQTYICRRKQD